jgi:aspartyl-tRNA(Asn)/glutamyl-tRNA(Gln) amidotransferase subunit B
VNLNRAGVPLVEIVSEADMRSSHEAGQYLRTLHTILKYAEVCDGNMEEGNFRCDANISVRLRGTEKFGTKVELKNINSFRYVEKAIDHEIIRQIEEIEAGRKIVQQTRLWHNAKGITEPMRDKEEAHDYRYFPEPDLPTLVIDKTWQQEVAKKMPELPDSKKARFMEKFGLSTYDASVLTASRELANYYEKVASAVNPKQAANWVMNELLGRLNAAGKEIDASPVSSDNMSELVSKIESAEISGKIAKTVFEEMFATGKSPSAIIKEKGLVQISDAGQLEGVIRKVIESNPSQVQQYKAGKDKLLGFFVGQVMKETKGQANPGVLNDLVKKILDQG